jgi:hypothetical protein
VKSVLRNGTRRSRAQACDAKFGREAENYLYISTARYGASWLLRPLVIPILVLTTLAILYPVLRKRVGAWEQVPEA